MVRKSKLKSDLVIEHVLLRILNYCLLPNSAEFEGDEYYKQDAIPTLDDGTQVKASVYVWQDSAR